MFRFTKFLLTTGAVLLCAASCSDDDTGGAAEKSFLITKPAASDLCSVSAADRAEAGDKVSVTVTAADADVEIRSVTYNDKDCTLLSSDQTALEYVYEFTMPEEDVVLKVSAQRRGGETVPANI